MKEREYFVQSHYNFTMFSLNPVFHSTKTELLAIFNTILIQLC